MSNMSKISVQKPFTVFVGIVLVLVLGVVAFTRMTTDLLPNMDLPYMVVYTADPGATPESVEASVTKPMEAALGSTTGLKSINSVSSENVSTVIMEFEQGTDMNAISIEMSNTIDQIKGSLPESAASPVMMQITPDMMPVMVASVDVDGMEAKEVSDYVSDTLLTRLERLDGVASVDTTGIINSRVKVTLDQDKINSLNNKVLREVDSELADAKEQLDEGQSQLDSAKAELTASQSELNKQTGSMTDQLGQASAQVDAASAQLNALLSEETTLQANLAAFQMELQQLQTYADMRDQIHSMALMIVVYDITGTIAEIGENLDDIGVIANGSAELLRALQDPSTYIANMPDENFYTAVSIIGEFLSSTGVDTSQLLDISRENFSMLVSTVDYAAQRVSEVEAEIRNINTRMATITAMKPELQAGLEQAQQAYAKVEAGKVQATIGVAQGSAQIAVGQASLESAQEQLDQALKEFEDARDEAYEKADINGIITADMISNILIAENFEMPAGYIKDSSDNSYILKVGETYNSVDELSNTVLFHMDSVGNIYLRDVASVEYASEADEDAYAKVNGNPAVVLSLSKQSIASTSAVSDTINEEIEAIQEENSDVHITPLMDQGDYIHFIVNNVLSNLIFGGILAVGVLLLFLRDIRPTIVIAFSIPLSVLFAIVLMYFSNMTLNLISLSGLSLGVGMLVDNSIVVIENIYRLRGLGMSAPKAAVRGAMQMGGAIFASTLTTICVFLPIVFTQGLARQLFTDMGLTIAYSLSASLVVALTVVPAMGSSLLKKDKAIKPHHRFDAFTNWYEKILRWCLKHRAITMSGVLALFLFSVVATTQMGMAFIPEMSSTQMSASMSMPEDSDEVEFEAMLDKVMGIIEKVDGVETVGGMSGGSSIMSTGSDSGGNATFYILLEEGTDNKQVADQIVEKTKNLNCEVSVSESTMDISAVTGSGVSIDVYGNDLDQLQDVCEDLASKLEDIEGLEEISDGNEDPDLQKVIQVNKTAAMQQGLTVAQVYASLAADLTSEVQSTTLTVGAEELPVVVIKPTTVTADNIMQQTVEATDAATGETEDVKLDTIASQSDSRAPTAINRENNERTISVTAAVDDAHNVTLVSRDVQAMLDSYDVPEGIHIEMTGENETIMEAMGDLVLMLFLAIIFIYMIMVAQFQSLLNPFIVMFTMPLAFTGGLIALLVTGQELSVLAMLGFVLLAGVVVNNGIVFVSCVNDLRLDGMPKYEALVQAGKMRIRPILMTALTTILAMSTMALGVGSGGEMGQAMAIVVIGGLSYATVLTLVVVPIIYDLFNRKETLKRIDIGEQDGELDA